MEIHVYTVNTHVFIGTSSSRASRWRKFQKKKELYIIPIGGLFKPGFVLGEDVCKIMYVTVHVTTHVTLAVLELVVLGSCLMCSSCHFQMRHCQMKPIDDVCEKSSKKSRNI